MRNPNIPTPGLDVIITSIKEGPIATSKKDRSKYHRPVDRKNLRDSIVAVTNQLLVNYGIGPSNDRVIPSILITQHNVNARLSGAYSQITDDLNQDITSTITKLEIFEPNAKLLGLAFKFEAGTKIYVGTTKAVDLATLVRSWRNSIATFEDLEIMKQATDELKQMLDIRALQRQFGLF